MQVRGKAPVTLVPGQTFYEGPDDVHVVSRNASHTAQAKFLVFFVKERAPRFSFPRSDLRRVDCHKRKEETWVTAWL